MRRQVQGQVIKWWYFRQLENTPELSSVAHEETIPEEKKYAVWEGRFSASPWLLQPLAPMSAAKAFPNCGLQQEEVSETSHGCFSKLHILVLKQSITEADPNKSWIMVILYKLQKSQEIGQPLPFLHENYHCSLQCVFLQTFLEPSPTHNMYTYIFFQP